MERAPKRYAVLRPLDEILGIEITVEGLGKNIEIDVVIV